MHQWALQDAKAKFSEMVREAQAEGPQEITLRGEPIAVVLSSEEYHRLITPRKRFVELIRSSPLMGTDVDFERTQTPTRELEL